MKYVALFRGINVGKSVQVSMRDLVPLLEGLGFSRVTTYLNSGNALFESTLGVQEATDLIEAQMAERYRQRIDVLVKTATQIVKIARSIPAEWANDKTQQTYVAYLFKDAARPSLLDELPIKREFMEIFYANACLVWNIKRENYTKSHITKIAGHPSYGRMTTRNSNTARKLAELCLA